MRARNLVERYLRHGRELELVTLERGVPPDNLVEHRTLGRADALLFRDALRTVTLVQGGLRERFRTDLLG